MENEIEDNQKHWKDMTITELKVECQKHQDWIDSDKNDGRLTTDSSAALDYAGDMIEELITEIKCREIANRNRPGTYIK